jgi:hypothetical protein
MIIVSRLIGRQYRIWVFPSNFVASRRECARTEFIATFRGTRNRGVGGGRREKCDIRAESPPRWDYKYCPVVTTRSTARSDAGAEA